MENFIDLTGQRFGRLTVIGRSNRIVKGRRRYWNCVCDCGNLATVRGSSLTGGVTRSCGCLHKDVMQERAKHGGFGTRLYPIWDSMRQRCNNPNNQAYHNYGGRGITICKEWDDFAVFKEWATKAGYDESAERGVYTLDRIDVDGDYTPENCRWVTMRKQSNNKRDTIYLESDGETHSLSEWSDIIGVSYQALWRRMKSGKTTEEILKERNKQT